MPPAPQPWNDWYHCMTNTYGTWLPGDPRGFRTRDHREHVQGDYKNPPPRGIYALLYERSKSLMKRPPIYLPAHLRAPILDLLIQSLLAQNLDVVATSLDDHHLHLLARFKDHAPRRHLAIAKHFATAQAKAANLLTDLKLSRGDGIWSTGSKSLPIADRTHQLAVTKYILAHKNRGAATWSCVQK